MECFSPVQRIVVSQLNYSDNHEFTWSGLFVQSGRVFIVVKRPCVIIILLSLLLPLLLIGFLSIVYRVRRTTTMWVSRRHLHISTGPIIRADSSDLKEVMPHNTEVVHLCHPIWWATRILTLTATLPALTFRRPTAEMVNNVFAFFFSVCLLWIWC